MEQYMERLLVASEYNPGAYTASLPPPPTKNISPSSNGKPLENLIEEEPRKSHPEMDPHGYSHPEMDPHGYSHPEMDLHGYSHPEMDPHGYSHPEMNPHGYSHPEMDPHGYSHPMVGKGYPKACAGE
ncbi:hypothetical protein STEG23_021105 [Scotinomys teguina]